VWEAELPPEAELLRQGDLLKGIHLPRLRLPLEVAHVAGTQPGDGAVALVQSYARDFLVVSQCCEIENGNYVALSLIRSTGPLNPDVRNALLAEQPPREGEEGGYVFDQFRLEPLAGLVGGDANRFQVADLGEIMSFGGERHELSRHRRARMTPEGRRLLRIKLSFYFGRVEDGDAQYLEELGIPVGARP
jgi:hypothetical protein